LLSGFQIKILKAFLMSPMSATSSANIVLLHLIILQIIKILTMLFSPASCHFLPLR
jgi:hypothetical protein